MDKITTPEQLKKFLKDNDRIKFSTKVFYVLQFVKNHPEFSNECGASWCSDGTHFISNSSLLGNILSIKPNTINTNFRSHAFNIIHSKALELSPEFPNLPDIKNWKKRINPKYNFTQQSFIEDINLIPCQPITNLKNQREKILNQNYNGNALSVPYKLSFQPSVPPITDPINFQNETAISQQITTNYNKMANIPTSMQLPPEAQQILANDPDVLFNTTFLLNKIKNNRNRNNLLISYATREWIQIAGNASRVDTNKIIDTILANFLNQGENPQLKANITYLLLFQTESTQQEEEGTTFDQFLNFFLRYGSLTKAASYINDLTLYNSTSSDFISGSPTQDNQYQTYSQKSSFCTSQFHQWFQPSFNAAVSTKMLEGKSLNTWLLRPSSTPGKFTVHYKSNGSGKNSVSATYVEFNPINGTNEHPFSVQIEGIGMVGADSWNSILFEVMKLDPANGIYMDAPNPSQHTGWSDPLLEQVSPFYLTPSQNELALSSSQRYF